MESGGGGSSRFVEVSVVFHSQCGFLVVRSRGCESRQTARSRSTPMCRTSYVAFLSENLSAWKTSDTEFYSYHSHTVLSVSTKSPSKYAERHFDGLKTVPYDFPATC